MARLLFDISMSLDGFIAGPNMTPEQGLGEGGEQLHEWAVDLKAFQEHHGREGGKTGTDSDVLDEMFESSGAIIIGKNMFGPWDPPWEGWWGDEPPFKRPVFVITHHEREPLVKGETTFTFVTDGIESALEQASDAAGGGDVALGGGANVFQQYLAAGLLDQIQIHLVPVLLGEGVRLFAEPGPEGVELEVDRVISSPTVTHLRYRVVK